MSGAHTPSAEQLLAALNDDAVSAIVASFERAYYHLGEMEEDARHDRAAAMEADEVRAMLDPLYPLVCEAHDALVKREAERQARLAG